MKTLQQYANEVMLHKNDPHVLADLNVEIAVKYAFLADIFKEIQIEKAVFWQQKFSEEKPLSDTFLEHKWRITEGGNKELRLKLELKSLQNLMGAIKTSSVVVAIEAKNNYWPNAEKLDTK